MSEGAASRSEIAAGNRSYDLAVPGRTATVSNAARAAAILIPFPSLSARLIARTSDHPTASADRPWPITVRSLGLPNSSVR
jgi:hypothetical protein